MKIESLVKEGYLNAEPREHGGTSDGILDFSASVNPYGASPNVFKAIKQELRKISIYPDPKNLRLKRELSNYLDVEESNIIIGNGATEIIHLFADTFIRKGDKVVIPSPTFYEYEFASKKNEANVNIVGLNNLDMLDLKGTKILFICNPNNPTGKLYENVKDIIDIAYNNSTLVMLDECFIEFAEHLSMIKYIKEYDNIIILRTFTKIFGLAGLRIGYAIANKKIIDILNKVKVSWSVNRLAEIAAIEALKDLEHVRRSIDRIVKNRSMLIKEINRLPNLKAYDSVTNFFLVKCNNSILLTDMLSKEGIKVRDCSNFTNMGNDHVRISVRKRGDNKRLVDALRRVIKDL